MTYGFLQFQFYDGVQSRFAAAVAGVEASPTLAGCLITTASSQEASLSGMTCSSFA